MSTGTRRALGWLVIVVVAAVLVGVYAWATSGAPDAGGGSASLTSTVDAGQTDAGDAGDAGDADDGGAARIAELYAEQADDVRVAGFGWVSRLLSDDLEGDRHQRFVLELDNGMTVLVAHNIDVAPRLDGLAVGDEVGFAGDYVYTQEGGTIHWTHRSDTPNHAGGWLEWDGRRYE